MPRRGYFLPQMTMRKVRDVLEARSLVEGQAAELAVSRATKDQIGRMAAVLKQHLPCKLNADTLEKIIEANYAFHRCLAEMTQNDELANMARRLLDRSARLVYLLKADRPQFHVHAVHRQIFNAIRRRDAKQARRLVIEDIRAGQVELMQ